MFVWEGFLIMAQALVSLEECADVKLSTDLSAPACWAIQVPFQNARKVYMYLVDD